MGVHQPYEQLALTVSGLRVRDRQDAIANTPSEAESFAALNNGLWLFKVEGQPIAVLLSRYTLFGEGRFTRIVIATLPDPATLGFARSFLAAVQEAGATSSRASSLWRMSISSAGPARA